MGLFFKKQSKNNGSRSYSREKKKEKQNKRNQNSNVRSRSYSRSGLVDFTDKISNQLLKDIETLSSLKQYISSH